MQTNLKVPRIFIFLSNETRKLHESKIKQRLAIMFFLGLGYVLSHMAQQFDIRKQEGREKKGREEEIK